MSLSADQVSAFRINADFSPEQLAVLVTCLVFVVVLLWGVWAIRTAYSGWATNQLSHREFVLVIVRFAALYLVLSFLLLS